MRTWTFSLLFLLLLQTFSFAGAKYRVLTLGIRHESNTFSTLVTKESDFSVLRGSDALKDQLWAEVFKKADVELIPILHAYAWPGGVVEGATFTSFMSEILDQIRKAGPVDGIYMDMHGALHAQGYADAQATLINKIREVVGPGVLIAGSFDLHGNLSAEFLKNIDLVTAFRTAPHRDGAETKARAAQMLIDALQNHWKPCIAAVTIPILVPGEKSITEVEPLHSIYAQIPEVVNTEGLIDASIFAGYCWADLPRSAMQVCVVAKDERYRAAAQKEADALARQIWDNRFKMDLDVPSGTIDEMIREAAKHPDKTVFISDSGDNTTAGAPGDNPQVINALLNHQCRDALVAGIVDNTSLQKCVDAGIGQTVNLTLGGREDNVFGKPLPLRAKVLFISPDSILHTGKGAVVIETEGVQTVLLNARRSFVKVNDFKEVGLDPLHFKIVVVKLGYLYPELRDIAPVHLMALTSGFCNLDMCKLPFKTVPRPCFPLDRDMVWEPSR